MKAQHKIEIDGSITITMNLKPEGSMLEQEEQIASALAEVGRLATAISLKRFDTDGRPVVVGNVKHTSRGEEKKLSNAVRRSCFGKRIRVDVGLNSGNISINMDYRFTSNWSRTLSTYT